MRDQEKVTTFKERFCDLVEQLGKNDTELANELGVSKQSISAWKLGTRSPVDLTILAIAQRLNVSVDWLMGFNTDKYAESVSERNETQIKSIGGFPIRTIRRPILGTIPCGDPVEAIQQSGESADVPEHIHCDFCLRCKGDSMIGARIQDGDIVFIRLQPDVDSGEIAAVMNGDGEATLKRIRKGKNSITLWPENPDFEPKMYAGEAMSDIRIIGKAVGFISTL